MFSNTLSTTPGWLLEPTAAPATPKAAPIEVIAEEEQRAAKAEDAGARRFFYVTEQGVMLKKVSERIIVEQEKRILTEVPMLKLEGVLLYGSIQISTQCMRALMDQGIRVSFFTRQGTFKGSLVPASADMASLRLRQYQCALDPAFSLEFARSVVRGKLLAQRAIAAAYARDAVAESLNENFRQLDGALAKLDAAPDQASLRGIEGSASRAYFQLFAKWNRSDLPFEGREKRGANDPVNILLNIGYSMLTRELSGLAEGAGFDPAIGFYHQAHGNRPSLGCDWVEEFRHAVVDRLVLTQINRRAIQAKDFQDLGDRGRRLAAPALRKFIVAYENAISSKGYREVMVRQLGNLLDTVRGTAPRYRTHLEGGE